MKPNNATLDELKAATGLDDFEDVTDEQFAKVAKKAAEGGVSLEQLNLLVQLMPQFMQLQEKLIIGLVDGLKKVVEGAQASQKAALEAVGASLDAAHKTLNLLAQNAQTDEARLEIAKLALEAGRQGLELARIIQQMDEVHSNFWWKIGAVLGTVSLAVLAVGATALQAFLENKAGKTEQKNLPRKKQQS